MSTPFDLELFKAGLPVMTKSRCAVKAAFSPRHTNPQYPIVGRIFHTTAGAPHDGVHSTWTEKGEYHAGGGGIFSYLDLVMAPQKFVRWAVYRDPYVSCLLYATEEEAALYGRAIRVEIEL